MRHRGMWALLWVAVQWSALAGVTEAQEGFFEAPMKVLDSPFGVSVGDANVTPDGFTLFFAQGFGGPTGGDIFVATRNRVDEPFDNDSVEAVVELNTEYGDGGPELSRDGLTIYFHSNRPGHGSNDIFVARRKTLDDPFGPPENVKEINGPSGDLNPTLTGDGLTIVFNSNPGGNKDLYIATRPSLDTPFGEPRNLEEINTEFQQVRASISDDGLTLFWSNFSLPHPPDSLGFSDFWMATRSSREEPFTNRRNVGPPISSLHHEHSPFISPDWPRAGAHIYFSRWDFDGISDIYQATWHLDCNRNLIDDLEEIDEGSVDDTNGNGIPDECESSPPPRFRRGDCNDDGDRNLSDATCVLSWLFGGHAEPGCPAALNTNGDDVVDLADPVLLLNFLFAGGPPPVAPFPECGPGMLPADKALGCANPPNCP